MDWETKIKNQHERSLSKLISIVKDDKKLLRSPQLWGALIICVSAIIYIWIAGIDPLNGLNHVVELSINILPDILGFNLGAYVLFISLSSDKLLDELSEPDDESDYSTYQHISAVFAWGILIQAFTLIIAYVFSMAISLEIESGYAQLINFLALALILFVSIYAVLLIYRIVMNVFSLGQVIHFSTIISKKEKENDQKHNHTFCGQ